VGHERFLPAKKMGNGVAPCPFFPPNYRTIDCWWFINAEV